jgi:hypothetical protein
MKTEIVSFYCDIDDRTYYSDHARRLRINCNENNIPHDIRELPSRGEYRLNCLAKPKFLLDVLMEKKKPFVWLDVDSLIHAELSIFDTMEDKCDVGFAYQGFPPHVHANHPKASPIYLTYKDVVIEFLRYWIERCEFNELNLGAKVFDHEILMAEVLPEFLPKMKLGMLGMPYAIWPGTHIPENIQPMITMGIADGSSKEKSLREMGLNEDTIKFNLVGNIK